MRPIIPDLGSIEPAGIPVTRFTTTDILPASRFPAWTTRGWPSVAALFDVTPVGPFETRAEQFVLDGLIVQFAWGTARRFDRGLQRIADEIDVLAVNVMLAAGTVMAIGGKARDVGAGDAVLVDAARPSAFELPEGHSIQLVLPRALATQHLGPVRELHGLVIPAPRAEMLVSHLNQIRKDLPTLSPAQGPRLARTLVDIVALAAERERPPALALTLTGGSTAVTLKAVIEENLDQPRLGVGWLTRRLGLSRSTVFRALKDEGGAESYIRARRLERVRDALADERQTLGIGELALRWGFSDAAHFSRLFKARFGTTPSDYKSGRPR